MSVAKIEAYLGKINIPFDLSELPGDAYLVGGSVRDAILQRHKLPFDLDFVLPKKAIATAKKFANLYQGGFVVLDEVREIARVVFDGGTLDLARQEGTSLQVDLQRRDFTINAIAYNLTSQRLVDPFNGLADLEQGVLRMVAAKNFSDDPLRLLRAYRQAAQLELTIESQTRQAIANRTALLKTIAAERVQAELNYLFTAPQGNRWLAAAIADGLLDYWLPHSKGINLEQLEKVTQGIKFCQNFGCKQAELTILSKLSALLATEADTAAEELANLKYARSQIKAVTKTVKYLPALQQMSEVMSLREQYFWFLEVKDVFPILMVRAIASNVAMPLIRPLIERYQNPTDPVAHPQPLVTGNELMQKLNLKPSRLIGELLTEIQVAYIESKIATPQQAIAFANSWLRSQNKKG